MAGVESRNEIYSRFTEIDGHERYGVNAYGEVINFKTKRILKPEVLESGYLRVLVDGKHYYIHKLVANAFVPNPFNKRYVLHLNHDYTDNFYMNLVWSNHYIYDR